MGISLHLSDDTIFSMWVGAAVGSSLSFVSCLPIWSEENLGSKRCYSLLEVYNKCMSNYDQQQTRSDLSNRYIKVFKDLFKKPCEIERESWQSCITHENARPWLLFIYGAMTVVSLYKIYRNMRAKSARITFNTNVSLKRRASN
jgi:hypothetical protein